ncbi:MAG: hypothetical protein A3D92_07860 [Bacteroidetes bacterium RIFCSPHIGHO2_02_FULL_44_7]|nr:MAG: hypothetical protein A3D92_07860 [Bacteroidetes bacterium RIFCSPHIGHO2_02_FULL_44_7]
MVSATDRQAILHILQHSFAENKAVNFAVRGGKKNEKGRQILMAYALWYAESFGEVIINETRDAAALLVEPQRKRTSRKSVLWDLRLAFRSIGILRTAKIMKREAQVKKYFPRTPYLYLWFIGVDVQTQGQGRGGQLLSSIKELAVARQLPIYLATSTERNFAFYETHGLTCTGIFSDQYYTTHIYCYSPA